MIRHIFMGGQRRRLGFLAGGLALLVLMVGAPCAGAVSLSPSYTTSWLAPWDMPFAGIESVATSPQGEYVYVGSAGQVIQYSAAGVWIRTWPNGSFTEPSGLATDPAGNVYVADKGRGELLKFTANGKHLATWSMPGARAVAADTHGHLYVLTSVFLGTVVDVRSYAGKDEGAWSAALPGTWFSYTGYLPPTAPGSLRAITTDRSGNVVLGGVSRQRLDGTGPDCSSVFSLHPEDVFEYADPLEIGEIARFSPTGGSLEYGWLSRSSEACYPGWYSDGVPNGVAVAPDDGSIWVSQGEHFFRRMVHASYGLAQDAVLDVPCLACLNPPGENYSVVGPEAFDCHGNLYVGADDRVLKYYNLSSLSCPSRFSVASEVALAPALIIVMNKPKKKTTKTLAFDAGCLSSHCTIGVLLSAHAPGCHGRGCLITLARGHFTLTGGRPHVLSLNLSRVGATLLAGHPGVGIGLSARLLRHGRAFGPTFHPQMGLLKARSSVALSLTCPAQGAVGASLSISGEIGVGGIGTLKVLSGSPAGLVSAHQVQIGAGGRFTFVVVPSSAGTWTFGAHFPGDSLHTPAGAACSTDVPGPPVGPVRIPPRPTPPPTPTPTPVTTTLKLMCPAIGSATFTGTLTPALQGVPVTITYLGKDANEKPKTVIHTVQTTAAGTYQDPGPGGEEVTGKATASWPGETGYTEATSPACNF